MNQERTSWVYKHDMFHRDRPEDLHLVRRVSGVDGRKNRINKLPTSALIENTEYDGMENSVDITPVNLRKKRFASSSTKIAGKKRIVGADISNLATGPINNDDKPATPQYVRILPILRSEETLKTSQYQSKSTSIVTSVKWPGFVSPRLPYKKSTYYIVGDLLTYDDETSELETIDTPLKGTGAPLIQLDEKNQEFTTLDHFVPNISTETIGRIALSVAWPRPGHPQGDLASASLAVLVLEGFTGKEFLLSKTKDFLQRFPIVAEEFCCYENALRGTADYSINKEDFHVAYKTIETGLIDMMHDFAAFATNRVLELPGLEDSLLCESDHANFCKALIDWKVAVQLLY